MFRRRVLLLAGLVAIAYAAIGVRLVALQGVEGADYARKAREARTRREHLAANRGAILDRNGIPLVSDERVYHLGLRVGYFWRGSPSGSLVSVLEAVRRAIPDEHRPPPVRLSDALEEPAACLGILLDATTRGSVLRIPRRRFRHDLYRRLAGLFGIEDSSDVVRALSRAPDDATMREVLLAPTRDGDAIRSDPFAVALRNLRDERSRLEDLAARCGTLPEDLIDSIQGALDRVWRQVDGRVERVTDEAARAGEDVEAEASRAFDWGMNDYPFRAQILARRISESAALHLFLHQDRLPGFFVTEDRERRPAPGAPVTILGWLAEVHADEIEEARAWRSAIGCGSGEPIAAEEAERRFRLASLDPENRPRIGIAGLERTLDGALRGRDGQVRILRDFFGKEEEVLEYEPSSDGCDVRLTLDSRVQSEVERVLAEAVGPWKSGAAIVMNADSGAILAMASHPTPDSERFREQYGLWLDDVREPLRRRTVQPARFPYPGSTFKIVAAAAALEEGRIDSETTYVCRGCLDPRFPSRFRCLGHHGPTDLHDAMVRSCNVYFYHLGEELGGGRLGAWARRFGFGERTGVELAEEDPGRVWTPADRRPWTAGSSRHLAIGQVHVEVTPLQVLRMVCAVGNGGRLVRPHLVLDGAGWDGSRELPARDVALSEGTLRQLREMLRDVVADAKGTAHGRGLERFEAAGKTGTAETASGLLDHAWFAGYAPWDDPEVGVVVFLEHDGGHGGETAAPVAARILAVLEEVRGRETLVHGRIGR